jgi:hypothetical protein
MMALLTRLVQFLTMEFSMNNQPHIPNPETAKRLLANLRQTHLEMCEFNRELDMITNRIEHDLQQQRLRRMGRSHVSFMTESNEVVG